MKHLALVLAIALAGCSAIQERVARDSEDILAEAGFRPEPLNRTDLPDRQLVVDGTTYKFADAKFCACVYVGGTNEFATLQRLRSQRLADRDWASRHSVYGNWGTPLQWGAWTPEGLDLMEAPVAHANASGR